MTDVLFNSEWLFSPVELGDVGDDSRLALSFAEDPAELWEELVSDYRSFVEGDSKALNNLGIGSDELWWRLWKSLLPDCPFDYSPVLRLMRQGENPDPKDIEAAGSELKLFAMWLEATEKWQPDAKPVRTFEDLGEQGRKILPWVESAIARLRDPNPTLDAVIRDIKSQREGNKAFRRTHVSVVLKHVRESSGNAPEPESGVD